MNKIYTDANLKYPLTSREYELVIDNSVWNFINLFYFMTYSVTEYRNKIINNINNNIKEDEFFILEIICEKLLWNLKDRIKYLYDNNCILYEEEFTEEGMNNIMNYFYDDTSYRSFINKLILIDDINNKIYYKKMEGSSPIFKQNDLNSQLWLILGNRDLYEKIMTDPNKIKSVIPSMYYYCNDYAFPNLNFGKPFIQSDNYRKKRINLMYYQNKENINWCKLYL
jgi:hypothetical protein